MKKYMTGRYDLIEVVEVLRETDNFVVIAQDWMGEKRERKEAKRGGYNSYFDTWKEARDFLIEEASEDLAKKDRILMNARARLHSMMAIPEQEPEKEVTK